MNIIKNKIFKSHNPKTIDNEKKAKSLDTIKKEAMLSLYKKARSLDDNQKEFESIKENFSNSKTGEKYCLFINYAYNPKIPEQKTLNLSYTDNEDEYNISTTILRGNKQDILDFLGDERNVSLINSTINQLKQKIQTSFS